MSISLVNGGDTVAAHTEITVLNPVLYTDAGTGSFFYDLYLKSNNAVVDGKWQRGNGAAYADISYTLPGSPDTYNTAVDGETATENYSPSIEVTPTSLGKLRVHYASSSGTPDALEYWYALRGPGLPTSLNRQGSGTGVYTREFFLDPDRNYTFTANIANASGSIYFTWKYYDGSAWVAYANGTDSSFVATPPTSGRVQFITTTSGSDASVWSLMAHS